MLSTYLALAFNSIQFNVFISGSGPIVIHDVQKYYLRKKEIKKFIGSTSNAACKGLPKVLSASSKPAVAYY